MGAVLLGGNDVVHGIEQNIMGNFPWCGYAKGALSGGASPPSESD